MAFPLSTTGELDVGCEGETLGSKNTAVKM